VWITDAKKVSMRQFMLREKRQQFWSFATCGARDTRGFENDFLARCGG
jgi:hypothetical protein